jgi:hypothetical protein
MSKLATNLVEDASGSSADISILINESRADGSNDGILMLLQLVIGGAVAGRHKKEDVR